MHYKIIEIFDSVEGEGKRQGLAATFIRLAGCNLRCAWCDTPYSHTNPKFEPVSLENILARVNSKFKRVTLTGGEPLKSAGVGELINALVKKNYEVNIETNGSVDITPYKREKNLFFSIDYKLISSGANSHMRWDNFTALSEKDVIKFVIADGRDIEHLLLVVKKLTKHYKAAKSPMPELYVTAAAGTISGQTVVNKIIKTPALHSVKVYAQLHKTLGVR